MIDQLLALEIRKFDGAMMRLKFCWRINFYKSSLLRHAASLFWEDLLVAIVK